MLSSYPNDSSGFRDELLTNVVRTRREILRWRIAQLSEKAGRTDCDPFGGIFLLSCEKETAPVEGMNFDATGAGIGNKLTLCGRKGVAKTRRDERSDGLQDR